jgi:hypothetical protein
MKAKVLIVVGEMLSLLLMGLAYVILRRTSKNWLR